MKTGTFMCWTASACMLLASTAAAATQDKKQDPGLLGIKDAGVFLRYRLEVVDQDSRPETARASTLLSLVHAKTGNTNGFEAFVEFRNVTNVGAENFNNTVNGRTQFPVVADPESTDVDQAYLSYTGIENTRITVGRRKMDWGNKRFISRLVWRQNQMSFDGAFIESAPLPGLELKYAYAYNVNRAFTDRSPIGNFDGNFHLANLSYDVGTLGKVTTYGYWLDMDDGFAQALSTRTFGANFAGSRPFGQGKKFSYEIEAAHQKDISNNPFDIGVGYFRAEPSVTLGGFKARAGYEVLGGNGQRGFQTPLALLHAYNGWADQFVVTPANGLRDYYGEVVYSARGGVLAGTNFTLAYHKFESDVGNIDYGTEWNAQVTTKLFDKVNLLAKVALYDDENFSTDTTKFWLQLVTRF